MPWRFELLDKSLSDKNQKSYFYPDISVNPIIIKNAKTSGRISQIIKAKKPKTITLIKQIKPIIIVNNLIINPRPREIKLKAKTSRSFLISRPRGLRVISLFQGETKVFKSKGIE